MPLTKVTSTMRTGTPLDARSFEQLLAAAYLAQQQREPLPFPSVRPLRDEAERLAALAEAHTIVHGNKLRVQETLQLVAERARRITGGTGAAIWLVRGTEAICQAAGGTSVSNQGQSLAVAASHLTPCLRDGAIFRCDDAQTDPRTRYDALPGMAQGSIVAVPIHHEGHVQGALEVTFAQPRGFQEADVRTCQILSGLVSETVALAAGQEQRNILESERTTLLEALDRLQPHLSKLLSGEAEEAPATKELAASASGNVSTPAGPTPSMSRFGKFLLAQQEQATEASARQDWNTGEALKPAPRTVQTSLNFSVAPNRTAAQHESRSGHDVHAEEDVHDGESHAVEGISDDTHAPAVHSYDTERNRAKRSESTSSAHLYDFDEQPFSGHAAEQYEPESQALAVSGDRWIEAEVVSPVAEQPAMSEARTFWRAHGANFCLAASALLFAATLIWAAWPHPHRAPAVAAAALNPADPSAPQAAPKLSAFEELLVSMGLAEAPAPPMTYTGTPGIKVWVDQHNALYYCPGAEPYGTTPKGKFMTQHDAQYEQFQPARGQPCD